MDHSVVYPGLHAAGRLWNDVHLAHVDLAGRDDVEQLMFVGVGKELKDVQRVQLPVTGMERLEALQHREDRRAVVPGYGCGCGSRRVRCRRARGPLSVKSSSQISPAYAAQSVSVGGENVTEPTPPRVMPLSRSVMVVT